MASPDASEQNLKLITGPPRGNYLNYKLPYRFKTSGSASHVGLTGYVLNKKPILCTDYDAKIQVDPGNSIHDGSHMFHIIFYFTGPDITASNIARFVIIRFLVYHGSDNTYDTAFNFGHKPIDKGWVSLRRNINLTKMPEHIWVMPELKGTTFDNYENDFLIVIPDENNQGKYEEILARVNAYHIEIKGDEDGDGHYLFPYRSSGNQVYHLSKPVQSFRNLRSTLNWQAMVLCALNIENKTANERKMMLLSLRDAVNYEYEMQRESVDTFVQDSSGPFIVQGHGLNSGIKLVSFIKWNGIQYRNLGLSFGCVGHECTPSTTKTGKFVRVQKMVMHLLGNEYYFKLWLGTWNHDDELIFADWIKEWLPPIQGYKFGFYFKDPTNNQTYNNFPQHIKLNYEPYYDGRYLYNRLAVVFLCKDQEKIKESPLKYYVFLDDKRSCYKFPSNATGPYSRQLLKPNVDIETTTRNDIETTTRNDDEYEMRCQEQSAFVSYGHYFKRILPSPPAAGGAGA